MAWHVLQCGCSAGAGMDNGHALKTSCDCLCVYVRARMFTLRTHNKRTLQLKSTLAGYYNKRYFEKWRMEPFYIPVGGIGGGGGKSSSSSSSRSPLVPPLQWYERLQRINMVGGKNCSSSSILSLLSSLSDPSPPTPVFFACSLSVSLEQTVKSTQTSLTHAREFGLGHVLTFAHS
jgi:hypothetical protein